MKARKTESHLLGPAGLKIEVLDMTYVGAMPEAAPAIHANVLQSPETAAIWLCKEKKIKIIKKTIRCT